MIESAVTQHRAAIDNRGRLFGGKSPWKLVVSPVRDECGKIDRRRGKRDFARLCANSRRDIFDGIVPGEI